MTDTQPPASPPGPDLEEPRRRRPVVSAVWLVPLVAVLIALAIMWQSWRDRGELIAITFPDASGVTIGETTLRFREVIVGVVEDVGFSSDLASVNVYVRVNREIAPFLDEDASFWIVQPQVTARGVEGLGTILSGTYIEGTWDSEIGDAATVFIGNDRAPIVPPGVDGTAIVLRAGDSARLSAGAPILFRGIQVGELASPRLSSDGTEVRIDAFVQAPYDRQITTATRFWDASGVTASLGGAGVEISVGSLAAIVEGGIVFDTLISGGQDVEPGHVFEVFEDRGDALASTFEAPTTRSVGFAALFPSAAAGLTEGAPVRYRGVRVGVVTGITGFVRADDPTNEVQLLANLSLQPEKMGLSLAEASDLDAVDYVNALVRSGLRAQLVSTSLFGGNLAVDLVEVVGAAGQAGVEIGVSDTPLIPTIEGETGSLTATAEGVLARINDLPVEEVLIAATTLLESANAIATDPDTRAIPATLRGVLDQGDSALRDVRAIVASPEAAGVLANLQAVSADVRTITDRLTEREIADRIADLAEAATVVAQDVQTITDPVAGLVEQAVVLFDDAGRLIGSEDLQAIPGLAREAVEAGRAVVTAPAIGQALDDVAAVTSDVRALTSGLDGEALAPRIDAVLQGIDAAARNVAEGTADLGSLRDAIEAAVIGARDLLASDDLQAIPATARAAVDDARDAVGDLRGAVSGPQLEAILADAAAATASIRTVTESLGTAEAAARITTLLRNVDGAARNVAAGTEDLAALRTSIDAAVDGAATLLASEDLAAVPALARQAVQDAADTLADIEVDAILADVSAVTSQLRALTDGLAPDAIAAQIDAVLGNVERASADVAAGTADLGTLRNSLDTAVRGAEALLASEDLAAVPGLARRAAQGAADALSGPAVDAILADVAAVTAQVRALTDGLQPGALAAQIDVVLGNVERASANVAAGTAGLSDLRATLDAALIAARDLVASPDAQAVPGLARDAAQGAADILAGPQIATTLDNAAAASGDLQALTARLAAEAVVERVERLIANLDTAAGDVAAGTADLASLRAGLDATVAGVETLVTGPDTQALPGAARGVVEGADALVGDLRGLAASPEIQTLLSDLPQITADIRALTQTLVEGQAALALTSALQAAERAAASVAEGAASLPALSAASQDVLAEAEILAQNLNVLTQKANALALDELVASTTQLMRSADAFISSDEADDVPVVLADALEEVRATVEAIRTGGTLDNLNATLTSASGAADSIRGAATDLPALVSRLQTLTDSATGVLSAYDSESRVAQELFATLRAASRAAEDVSSLARTIERNPNSLLLGR